MKNLITTAGLALLFITALASAQNCTFVSATCTNDDCSCWVRTDSCGNQTQHGSGCNITVVKAQKPKDKGDLCAKAPAGPKATAASAQATPAPSTDEEVQGTK